MVRSSLRWGEYAPFAPRIGLCFAALGVLLELATIIVILAQPV